MFLFKGDLPKWVYTFFLLIATLWWARFLVVVVREAIAQPNAERILGVAGVGVLLGALITWNGVTNTYWFRKKPKDQEPPKTGP